MKLTPCARIILSMLAFAGPLHSAAADPALVTAFTVTPTQTLSLITAGQTPTGPSATADPPPKTLPVAGVPPAKALFAAGGQPQKSLYAISGQPVETPPAIGGRPAQSPSAIVPAPHNPFAAGAGGTGGAGGKLLLSQQQRDPSAFPGYVDQLRNEALAQGIAARVVQQAFATTHFVDRVVSADHNQPEKKITLDDYLQRALPAAKIEQGRQQYQLNQPQLATIGERYGVPGNIIIALWGMKSSYGKIQGRQEVISALANPGVCRPSRSFFSNRSYSAR